MIEPIVHIGYPKTATKWLQNEFFSHISFLGPSNHILHIAEGDVVYSYDLIEKESSIVGLRVETDGKVEVFDSCAVSKK